MAKNDYFISRKINTLQRIDNILNTLPKFVYEYFIGIENNTSPLTRLNYATDLQIFFNYISSKFDVEVLDMDISLLDKITSMDIEQFLSYLSSYEYNGKIRVCNENAKARKLSTLRSLFKYFFNKNMILANVASKVSPPKIHEKEIIRLESYEVKELLETCESGNGFSSRQLNYNRNTKIRDIALLTLFLGTGIRISELVGLNVNDIFFDNNSFIVTRKGGNRTILYFTEEVANELKNWIEYRSKIEKLDKNEDALFISLKNKRLSVRAVEEIVKKYAKLVTPLKHITPHKLRSTFGTNLYRETGDIYVVADLLGHKDINTTKRHYAAISEDIRKEAIKSVKIKKD